MKLIRINTDHYIIVDDSGKDIYTASLSEVKELLGEVDVLQESKNYVLSKFKSDTDLEQLNCYKHIETYIQGYNQALEDNKGKRFTEEDMIRAYRQGGKNGAAFESICQNDYNDAKRFEKANDEKFMDSLQPPTSWDIEIVNGKLKLV